MQSTELSKKRPTPHEGCTSQTSTLHTTRGGMLLYYPPTPSAGARLRLAARPGRQLTLAVSEARAILTRKSPRSTPLSGFFARRASFALKINDLFSVLVSRERLSVAVKSVERSIVAIDSEAVPLSWGGTGTEARDQPRAILGPEPWRIWAWH
jgi:hypothetical protein